MTTAEMDLIMLCVFGLALWIAIAYAYGRVWSWRHNKRRRARYARRVSRR